MRALCLLPVSMLLNMFIFALLISDRKDKRGLFQLNEFFTFTDF